MSAQLLGGRLRLRLVAGAGRWLGRSGGWRMDWAIGLLVAATAMLGDLFSSFTKRRINLVPGSMALGLVPDPGVSSCQPSLVDGFCRSPSWISF